MARKAGSNGEETAAAARAAALRLFARSGYSAVTMREIAAEIGVGAGALYNYWPAKQDLLADLLARHMRDLADAADAALPSAAAAARDPAAALDAFVRFHIRFHIDRPDAVFVSYMELRALEPENFRRIEALRAAYEGRLRAILEAGRATARFDVPDVKVAAMALIAMLTGVNTWYRSGGRLSPERIEAIYAAMAAQSVGAAARPSEGSAERPADRPADRPAQRRDPGEETPRWSTHR